MNRESINFDRPTSELLDNLENIRNVLSENYDDIIEYFEENLIRKLYPTTQAWLEYPEDEFDEPMDSYSEEFRELCNTLALEDEWHLVFPVMVTSKNRDVQVGSLDLSMGDYTHEDRILHLKQYVNKSIPKSYRNMLARDTDSIIENFKATLTQDMLSDIFQIIATTQIYRMTMSGINSDRIIKETLSKYSLPFLNDIAGIENKSAPIIPYMETYLIYENMHGKLKDSIDTWCRENVRPDAFSEVFLGGTTCMVSIMSKDDYGCSLIYEFLSETAQVMWPSREGDFTELAKKLKPQKNIINEFVKETITKLGIFDACQDIMLYQIELETLMEETEIGYKPNTYEDEERKFDIFFKETTFPKEIWKDEPVFTCSNKDIEHIRTILPKLKQHAYNDDSFTKIEYTISESSI